MRLFLAIEIPAGVQEALGGEAARLRAATPGWRWVRPGNVHLTLRFLGETPAEDVQGQHTVWREVARGSGPIRFGIAGCGVFPGPRKPRILWAGVRHPSPEGALERLAAALEEAARGLGYRPENRIFRAHLTLARAGRGGTPVAPEPTGVGDMGEVLAEELVLFRSELHPSGARYEAIGRYPLGPGSGG